MRKFSTNMITMKRTWIKVYESFNTYIKDKDKGKRMETIISLSYDALPYHLRGCYHYFGMFSEDFEIPAWKLICMWIAEGLIQHNDDLSLEETAEDYLDELINRNLVRVDKFKPNGRVKIVRIHDMLRDFCLTKAGIEGEDFLKEIKRSRDGSFQPTVAEGLKFRRLCIHSDVLSFVSKEPDGENVWSFVCFSRDKLNMPEEYISFIHGGFKLLRVLEAESIKFTKLSSDMYRLLHLRYLVLSACSLKVFPSSFSKLRNIQSLVVTTDSPTLDVKADILNMTQLRHFKTSAPTTLPNGIVKTIRIHDMLRDLVILEVLNIRFSRDTHLVGYAFIRMY